MYEMLCLACSSKKAKAISFVDTSEHNKGSACGYPKAKQQAPILLAHVAKNMATTNMFPLCSSCMASGSLPLGGSWAVPLGWLPPCFSRHVS